MPSAPRQRFAFVWATLHSLQVAGFRVTRTPGVDGRLRLPEDSGMSKRRIYDNELYAHFVTFSCYKRRRLLDNDHARRIVLGVLNSELMKRSAKLIGFVLMPDHVHALVWFPEAGQLSPGGPDKSEALSVWRTPQEERYASAGTFG